MTDLDFQIVRGGRLLDIAGHSADPKDILIEGYSIREIGEPGMAAPDGAREVDAVREERDGARQQTGGELHDEHRQIDGERHPEHWPPGGWQFRPRCHPIDQRGKALPPR